MVKAEVNEFYDAVADVYSKQYDKEGHNNLNYYPSNYFRLQKLLNSFISKGVKRVLEVGVGEGTPLVTLAKAGIDVCGFDLSQEMVKKAKENAKKAGLDPDNIFLGDITDPITYTHCLRQGLFDGIFAMGVMPHVKNDEVVLNNMAACVKEGGSLFVEFRNKLFSLFTFNRYTLEFILDDLLKDVTSKMKDLVKKELESKLRMDMPPVRDKVEHKDAPGYDAILSKFHNPFEIEEMFKRLGFKDIKFLWYHYHPAMPFLEKDNEELFRQEARNLEHEISGWRGMFLCSAFVIEAVKA